MRSSSTNALRPLTFIVFATILLAAAATVAQTEYLEPDRSGILLFGQGARLDRSGYANNGIHGGGISFSSRGKYDFGVSISVPEGEHADPVFFFGGRYFFVRRVEDSPFDVGLTAGCSMVEHYIGMHFGCTFHRHIPISESVAIVPGFVVDVAQFFALEENWPDQSESAIAFQAGLQFKLRENFSFILEPGYVFGDDNAVTLGAGLLLGTGNLFGGTAESTPSLLN